MKFSDLIDIFKAVATDYVNAGNTLEFIYDRFWAVNGSPDIDKTIWLVDCSPDFNLDGTQTGGREGRQEFKGKFFFFDNYWEGEQATKTLWVKQSELNELAMKIIGEVKKRQLAAANFSIEFNGGFFGKDVNNAKLIEVYCDFVATINSECTSLI